VAEDEGSARAALNTGASGIGLAVARNLAAYGCGWVIADRDEASGRSAVARRAAAPS
jgi:NAD(P)-dependent dehydrogenase (short-subunit alcohol dehydrogenase family)